MPGVDGFEEETESEGPLDPSKWRQNGVNYWRLDLDIELFHNFYGNDDDLVDSREPQEYVSGRTTMTRKMVRSGVALLRIGMAMGSITQVAVVRNNGN